MVATEAANRKKDIYGEKPLAHTIAEQQAIVRAVEKNNILWQTGSWQRSLPSFHKAAEIVRNGLIGNIVHVEVGLPRRPSRLSPYNARPVCQVGLASGEDHRSIPGCTWNPGLGPRCYRPARRLRL